jgi:hypothetical protein
MKPLTNVFFIAAIAAIVTVSCKSKDSTSSDPKIVLTSFFERLSKKDFDGASQLASKDSKSMLDMMKMGMDMAEKMKGNMSADKDMAEKFKDVKIDEAKIDGDKATVAIENNKTSDKFDFPLVKEDGNWKVDFSMSTLMKMGMNMADKKKDMNSSNNTDDGKYNQITADSLKKELKKADSLLKTVDPEKMKEAMKALEQLKQH